MVKKLKYTVKTAKENLNRVIKFADLEPDDKKDLNISIAPYADQSYDTKYVEIEIGIQVNRLKFAVVFFVYTLNKN